MDDIRRTTTVAVSAALIRHPLVWFAAGAAVGYYAFKYRKEIVAIAARATDMGRDFVQQQKESLADLLEEAREGEEGGGGAEGAEGPNATR